MHILTLMEFLENHQMYKAINDIYNEGLINPIGVLKIVLIAESEGLELNKMPGYSDLIKADYRHALNHKAA